jgi:Mrp family chromosome partitioning ATPase
MDRIRKALDLAREQRTLPAARAESAAEPKQPSKPRSVTRLPTEIRYTMTRSFSPPRALLESNRIVDVSRAGSAAAAFRMLRTQVLQRMQAHQWRSIAVVSPSSDDGKTTTAINLAISLANDHRHTVLLVEFDLKRPTMAAMLGIVPEVGTDDVLRGAAAVEDTLYHPEGFDRLVVMPARAPMEHSSEALAGSHCRALVTELRERYPDRILVFDLPPVLGADDALAFAPLVECALIVVAEGLTRREDLVRCMELLSKTPIVGTVLNRATDVATTYD